MWRWPNGCSSAAGSGGTVAAVSQLTGDSLSLQHTKLQRHSVEMTSLSLLRSWVCRPLLCIRQF